MLSWFDKLLKPGREENASSASTDSPACANAVESEMADVRAESRPASSALENKASVNGEIQAEKHKDSHLAATVLAELRHDAEKRVDSSDWNGTEAFFKEAALKWDELDAERSMSEQWQAFDKARSKFNSRHSCHIELKKALTEREGVCVELERLLGDASPEARQKYDSLRASWPGLSQVPPEYWEILEKRFKMASQKYAEFVKLYDEDAGKRQAAEEKLSALGTELEALAASSEWGKAESRLAEIEKEIIPFATTIGLLDDWKQKSSTASAVFRGRKEAFEREREEGVLKELEQLSLLCDEMERIAALEDVKEGLPRVREIQAAWGEAILAPKQRKGVLTGRYEKAKKQFYDKLTLSRQAEDLARWENYAAKLILCEKAEALGSETVIREVAHSLKDLRADWKKIGPAPKEKSEEVWKRFDTACEAAYSRCKEHYDKLHEERIKNLELKTALCEKAEALRESTEWKPTTDKLKELQAEWKTVGRCEPAAHEEVFKRFRSACDAFFDRLKSHRAEVDKVNEERRIAKEALCVEAEALAGLCWKSGFDKARELQRRWKEVGLAKKEHEQALWARFNGAVEAFFTKIDTERPANQAKKEELIQKVKSLLGSLDGDIRYNEVADTLKDLSNQWNQTGPAPKEKEKELWDAFNQPMKEFFDKRQKFLDEARCQRERNLEAKLSLIAKIETIAHENEHWLKATDAVRAIQEEWKALGSVPREREEEVKSRYHAACDAFFGNKREFFEQQRKDRNENLGAKRKLCERLERIVGIEAVEEPIESLKGVDLAMELKAALEGNSSAFTATSTRKPTRSEAFEEIKRIQDEWKKIGPVPKEHDEKIFHRYRRACDTFFNSGRRASPAVEPQAPVNPPVQNS